MRRPQVGDVVVVIVDMSPAVPSGTIGEIRAVNHGSVTPYDVHFSTDYIWGLARWLARNELTILGDVR